MWRSRLTWLAALVGAAALYAYYTGYASLLLLLVVAALPVFSLLLSIPALLGVSVRVSASQKAQRGQEAYLQFHLKAKNPFPLPRILLRVSITHSSDPDASTQETLYLGGADLQNVRLPLPTAHCGVVRCSVDRYRAVDYLGIFAFRHRIDQSAMCLITPIPTQPEPMPMLLDYSARNLVRKPGGGFSEEHELRAYVEGDSLKSVHWKLSSKMDDLIVREPIEERRKRIVLSCLLSGTPAEIDSCLDQMLFLSERLLSLSIPHGLLCQTGGGRVYQDVGDPVSQRLFFRRVLSLPPAEANAVIGIPNSSAGLRNYRIRPQCEPKKPDAAPSPAPSPAPRRGALWREAEPKGGKRS